MAIPTTQKECTTRRIAALIIGLWDKIKNAFLLKTSRGTANGVASLDANGKVPSSQVPKIGTSGIADDAITAALVKDGETLPVNISGQGQIKKYTYINGIFLFGTLIDVEPNRYGGAVFLVTTRDYQDHNNVFLLYLQRGGYKLADSVVAKAIVLTGRSPRPQTDAINFYYNARSDNKTDMYIKVDASQYVTISLLSDVASSFSIENISSSLPGGATAFSYCYNVSMTSGYGGDASTPVYINGAGEVQPCTNVPVIEHVTNIPVNPTVGTIYAL